MIHCDEHGTTIKGDMPKVWYEVMQIMKATYEIMKDVSPMMADIVLKNIIRETVQGDGFQSEDFDDDVREWKEMVKDE